MNMDHLPSVKNTSSDDVGNQHLVRSEERQSAFPTSMHIFKINLAMNVHTKVFRIFKDCLTTLLKIFRKRTFNFSCFWNFSEVSFLHSFSEVLSTMCGNENLLEEIQLRVRALRCIRDDQTPEWMKTLFHPFYNLIFPAFLFRDNAILEDTIQRRNDV